MLGHLSLYYYDLYIIFLTIYQHNYRHTDEFFNEGMP